ncbi:hypothetical protein INT45_009773 [Circinella minor]|uniref:CxC2-like cysteine cluster KDZ transposase-associated domain-containing protein n=1 Tax=Circinella minor TaxID=1195481 RepID=A0A8H7RIB3_9FUNG|nr:hypothetical protein INT45_009773 [Circinella minor]
MPPKYRGFGTNEKFTFRSFSRTGGLRETTHVQRVTPTVDQNGSHQIPSSINRIRSSEWEDVDESTRKRKRSNVEDRVRNWANILPMLTDAFKQGCGVQTPLPEALTPIEDPLLCPCPGKSSKFITCVFKCGMCKSSIRVPKIEYCKNCQEHSLPVVLMRRHLFPLTPNDPNVAIHVEQIRTMHLMHYICRTSIHAIYEWAKVEYHYQLPIPASFKQRLGEALPMYGRMVLNIEKDHRISCGLENVCPACKYMNGVKTVAADGNFQLSRYMRTNDRAKNIAFDGQDEVDRYWVKPDNIISYNERAEEGCTNFQALNKKGGNKTHLDQTGVFACTCGHGYPLVATDMTTPGESYGYILSCLKQVLEMPDYGSNIRICYDVGCKLRTSLERTECLASIKNVPIAVGTNLKSKFRRTCLLRQDALKSLKEAGIEEDDDEKMHGLKLAWDDQIKNTITPFVQGSGKFAASHRAIENLRVAIAIFDLIDRAFRVQGNGHNRTQNLAAQRRVAREQVARKLRIYNEKIRIGPVFGFEPCENVNAILHKDSHFRFRMNITKLLTGKEPFDAFHGLQRANEELLILKDEATSVLKYADTIVEKLRNALNVPVGPYSLSEYYKLKGMALLSNRRLHRANAWKKEQKKLLTEIFDGTAALAAGSTIRIDEHEEDVLVEVDGVTDELSGMEEEVMDDQQFEVDTDFVNMFQADDIDV